MRQRGEETTHGAWGFPSGPKALPTVGPDAFFDRAVLDYTHPVPCELC